MCEPLVKSCTRQCSGWDWTCDLQSQVQRPNHYATEPPPLEFRPRRSIEHQHAQTQKLQRKALYVSIKIGWRVQKFKKRGGAKDNALALSSFITNAHSEREKASYWKKTFWANRGRGGCPTAPPLNRPLSEIIIGMRQQPRRCTLLTKRYRYSNMRLTNQPHQPHKSD